MNKDGLRTFQTATVKHVIDKLENNGSGKFLVADEVGLGKTKVAKAVIRHFLEKNNGEKPLTVLYLCANQQLAWQNLRTFHFFNDNEKNQEWISPNIRLGLLAWRKMTDETGKSKKLHLFALTPGTSDPGTSSTAGAGNMEERALITVLLDEDRKNVDFQTAMAGYSPQKKDNTESSWEKKLNTLYEQQDKVGPDDFPVIGILRYKMLNAIYADGLWPAFVRFYRDKNQGVFTDIESGNIVKEMHACFIAYDKANNDERLKWRKDKNYPGAPISFMRRIMAKIGLQTVKPDLIIMDEFQRFDDRLFSTEKDSEKSLFFSMVNSSCDCKILLLSATPYATFAEDESSGNTTRAHSGFIRLLNWLSGNGQKTDFEKLRKEYFEALEKNENVLEKRDYFQNAVLNYMCRTERRNLKKTPDENHRFNRDFPYSLWHDASSVLTPAAEEVLCYNAAYNGCKDTPAGCQWNQLLDFAKYSTKPLSFMKDYQLQEPFLNMKGLYHEEEDSLKSCSDSRIVKLQELLGKLFEKNLLWIPPTRPRRKFEGDFKGSEGASKILIFSSWRFIPRMISTVLSAQYSAFDAGLQRPDNPLDQVLIYCQGQSPWHPAQALASAIRTYFPSFSDKQIQNIVNGFIPEFCSRIFFRQSLEFEQNKRQKTGQNKQLHLTRKIIDYCKDGCLEDVFDEYIYMIRGQMDDHAGVDDLKGYLNTKNVRIPSLLEVEFAEKKSKVRKYMSDCFGETDRPDKNDTQPDEDDPGSSQMNLQRAFNSPFAPFVLSTTSIGQEGLDFHWYCRKIIHWNIPGNPIEMEQRNGRIDRFHSLSVRQSVAAALGKENILEDDWKQIIDKARDKWPDESGLSPDWYIENPSCPIEQYAYYLPFSKDEDDLRLVCFQSGYYRAVLGQPNFQEFRKRLVSPMSEAGLNRQKQKSIILSDRHPHLPCH